MFAVLTVGAAPPVIEDQPVGDTRLVGDDAYFEVYASGDNDLTYRWRKNGAALTDNDRIFGAEDSALVISELRASDAGNYSVVVKDSVTGQTVTSANAVLKVLTPPSITTLPKSQTVVAGSKITFTVKAAGTSPFTYQWMANGVNLAGATGTSLTLTNVQPEDEGDYAVEVSNEAVNIGADPAISDPPAILTVLIPPTITEQPESVVIEQGGNVLFSVEAEGTDTDEYPIAYQWRFKGKNIAGETDSLLELLDVQPSDAGAYSVVVSVGGVASVTSSNADLTVVSAPLFTLQPQNRTVTAGNSATFTAKATGTEPIAYQWRFNGEPIPGANKSNYTFQVTSTTQAGNYSVVASNIVDDVESSDAYLTVKAETVKPTVAITFPAANQRWSNAVITVRGKAADNAMVAFVDYADHYAPGGQGFQRAAAGFTNANPYRLIWTNWTATYAPKPGTNLVRAVATDESANRSTTAELRYFYVVPSPLTLLTNGRGTVALSPAAPGNILEIGRAYTLTATPGTGFGFVGWDGGTNPATLLSTNRTLTFMMISNLVLRANFRDVTKPTVTITSPPANTRFTEPAVTFQGTAKDNGTVDHVEYQLNDGPFEWTTGASNWSASVLLQAGTNLFRVKSVDTATNESLPAVRSVFHVVPSPLTLVTNGNGRVTGVTNGQLLEVGRAYKATAAPNAKHLFAEWTGNLWSTNPALTFLMQTNLVLQANFVTNPFVALKGTYYGLFGETNGLRNHDRSGSFTLTLAEAGSYGAGFQFGAKKVSSTGKFDWLGRSWLTLKPAPASNVNLTLQLDVTNYAATIAGALGNPFWWGELSGYRAPVYPATNASPQTGKYTLVIAGSDDPAALSGGDGYGTVTISKAGTLMLAGKLGDGTTVSQGIPVSAEGWWPLYVPIYTAKGSVQGWLAFTNEAGSDVAGWLSWIKPAMAAAKQYPLGFTNEHEATGSLYVSPGTTNRVLNFTNGIVSFRGGNLPQPFTNLVLLAANNKVTNQSLNKLTLTVTLPTGLFTGSATDPNTGKAATFNGALLQKLNAGYGHFLGTNQSGQVIFEAAP